MANPEQNPSWPFRPGFSVEKLSGDVIQITEHLSRPTNWRHAIATALIERASTELRTQLFPVAFYKTNEGRALFGYRTALVELLSEPREFADTPQEIKDELLQDVIDSEGKTITPQEELESARFHNGLISPTEPLSLHTININSFRYHARFSPLVSKYMSITIYMHGGNPDGLENVPKAVLEATQRPTLVGRIQALHDYNLVAHKLKDDGLIPKAA